MLVEEGDPVLSVFLGQSYPSATVSANVHCRCNPSHSQLLRSSGPGIPWYLLFQRVGWLN